MITFSVRAVIRFLICAQSRVQAVKLPFLATLMRCSATRNASACMVMASSDLRECDKTVSAARTRHAGGAISSKISDSQVGPGGVQQSTGKIRSPRGAVGGGKFRDLEQGTAVCRQKPTMA